MDSARHFLPLGLLMATIDAMAATKLNVLHWHITDAESFPLESAAFPQLAQAGAWAPQATYSAAEVPSHALRRPSRQQQHTLLAHSALNLPNTKHPSASGGASLPPQVRRLVRYARGRGVRVIPEFDIPGHGSWGRAFPSLMACKDTLDPTQDAVYEFLAAFLGMRSHMRLTRRRRRLARWITPARLLIPVLAPLFASPWAQGRRERSSTTISSSWEATRWTKRVSAAIRGWRRGWRSATGRRTSCLGTSGAGCVAG